MKEEQSPFKIQLERLPKMKTAIRFFALFVAVAGLASCIARASQPRKSAIRTIRSTVTDPGPTVDLPGPVSLPIGRHLLRSDNVDSLTIARISSR